MLTVLVLIIHQESSDQRVWKGYSALIWLALSPFFLLTPSTAFSVEEESYIYTRAEGKSLTDFLLRPDLIFNYGRKYCYGRMGQSQDVIKWFDHQRTQVRQQVRRPTQETVASGETATLAMVGDIMWIRRNWGNYYSQGIVKLLHSFDAVVGNLETPIAPSNPVPASLWPDVFWFNAYPDLLRELEKGGASPFAALGIANNHSIDKGENGLMETMEQLDAMGIGYSGVAADGMKQLIYTFERKSIRFGLYATTYGYNDRDYKTERLHLNTMKGIVPPVVVKEVDFRQAKLAIREMVKRNVDVKILSIHWGNEFELYPDPSLLLLGKQLIAMGFDVVMGNHPHVVQPTEICFVNQDVGDLKGCLIHTPDGRPRRGVIFYSLGTFATAMFTPLTRIGVVQQLSFVRRRDGVEWFNPEHTFVINPLRSEVWGPESNTGLILEDELERIVCPVEAGRESQRNCERLRLHLQYLENHLTGREDDSLTNEVKRSARCLDLIF